MNNYDIIIVGGGPIGMACAIEAKKNKLNYLVIEKGTLVNSLYNYPLYMTFFSTSEKLEIGEIPFTNTSFKPGRKETLEYYRRVNQHFDLNIHYYERVLQIQSVNQLKLIKTDKTEYKAKEVIIAIGFYDKPMLLNIPGEHLDKVSHYFKEAHPYSGQKLVVVGASNSAVDAALECWRKGSDVTMVVRKGEISDHVKYWIKPDIENRIDEGSIKTYFYSEIKEIKEKSVIIKTNSGIIELENDFVLALTGYRPDIDFLSRCGIDFSNDGKFIPVFNPNTMETNVKGIYLAGVVCGGLETHNWIIENSIIHSKMIISAICNK